MIDEDKEHKDFLKKVIEEVNSPQGQEIIEKVKTIMKRDNCSKNKCNSKCC